MAILQESDFLNNPVYDIARTKQSLKELPALIDDVEKNELQQLLGCELYELFIADLTANTPQTPQNSPYTEIFDPFCKNDYSCGPLVSKGIKDMLMAFVYFQWHSYNLNKSVAGGVVRVDAENSEQVTGNGFNIYVKQNRGIATYQAIQQYICENLNTYPTYDGITKNNSGII